MTDPYALDATGLTCPRPVLMLAEGLTRVPIGGSVILTATDPTSKVDVPVWCRRHRQRLTELHDSNGVFRFTVTRVQ